MLWLYLDEMLFDFRDPKLQLAGPPWKIEKGFRDLLLRLRKTASRALKLDDDHGSLWKPHCPIQAERMT